MNLDQALPELAGIGRALTELTGIGEERSYLVSALTRIAVAVENISTTDVSDLETEIREGTTRIEAALEHQVEALSRIADILADRGL